MLDEAQSDSLIRKVTDKYRLPLVGNKSHYFMMGVFVLLLSIVSLILNNLHDDPLSKSLYLLFPVLLLTARFHPKMTIKKVTSISALMIVLVLGILDPVDVEEIEEAFIFIPLLYIMIFPHSLWPIMVAFLLLLTYLPTIGAHDIYDFIEDCAEIVLISTFAGVMSFFQHKSKRQAQYFQMQSLTDDLTSILNRKAFNQDIQSHAQQWQVNRHYQFALIIVDLDDFKRVNDQYGHHAGDELLIAVVNRYLHFLQSGMTLYRLGGDEFCILVHQGSQSQKVSIKDRVHTLVETLHESEKQNYRLECGSHKITPTIGVSFFPEDTTNTELLNRNADLAMYSIKKMGKNGYAYYKREMFERILYEYAIEKKLRTAIKEQQFYLVYQPQLSLTSGAIIGVEALLRWQEPELGFVSPADFIPIAESSGSIVPIGEWVLKEACAQLALWQKSMPHIHMSVNLSAVQVHQDNLVAMVTDIISNSGIDPNWLELELTETAMMSSPEEHINKLHALSKMGIKLAIDDFGVAYSSLAYLTKLPINTLKIDKSFVDNCKTSHQDRMIVRTIVQLSKNLHLSTVAEGVEDDEQRKILHQEGADFFQGYLFSKPVSPEDIEALINSQ
ncbi:putative bifunctional diguanylate cyclase/phosphodiesterase [Aliivibrio kagoshimensis]|uniref:putative bifunctional diguanylate cyclase/phosphodiesterase n=1 Tax=Aliivibrio kagoshimensis TaxID=2910230 RepID=UPI003D0A507D